mmetsp:Transcript_37615/g.27732  ORF Transcript_37615/g.27732 Transcript_37615/m.27732 type:complete len:88 (-) Transcript_37615:9-272(-)
MSESETKPYSMKKADIWSLGITLYCLTYQHLPFEVAGTGIELMNAIANSRLEFPEERKISPELQEFLSMMLEKNPENRADLKLLKNS